MILTGSTIICERQAGRIWIDPFVPHHIQPNSYDFTLGHTLLRYTNETLDVAKENTVETISIDHMGFVLQPDRLYLGHTVEKMGSSHYVPIIRGRSSIARLGLFIHVTADIIDIGSHNQWTLQLHAVQPLRVYPGMRIGQVTFWTVQGEIVPYTGKYQGSIGPTPSLSHHDFRSETDNDPKRSIDSLRD